MRTEECQSKTNTPKDQKVSYNYLEEDDHHHQVSEDRHGILKPRMIHGLRGHAEEEGNHSYCSEEQVLGKAIARLERRRARERCHS